MGIIDDIASFVADLLGCTEDDTECLAKAKKYATWLILLMILAIVLFLAPKIYKWSKGGTK